MNQKASAVGQFEPLHDAHAIEQIQIIIGFSEPLGPEKISHVREAMNAFQDELPGETLLQSISLLVEQSPGATASASTQSQPNGFARLRAGPDAAIQTEVRIEPTAIRVRTTVYTRWATIWAQIGQYLRTIVGTFVENSKVTSVSLVFVDKFVWNGQADQCKPASLLRAASRHLCPHVFTAPDMWHSHTGAFSYADRHTKRLMNVNVDYLEEPGLKGPRRVVGIATVLTDMFNQPELEPLHILPGDAFSSLEERLGQLHDVSKDIFADVISDAMCDRIALVRGK